MIARSTLHDTVRLLLGSIPLVICGQTVQAQDTSSSHAGTRVLEEVMVTAQKRDESLQRAPAAITVVGADQLTQFGVTDAKQLVNLVPGTRFNFQNSNIQFFIRGVGNSLTNTGVSPGVVMNYNGVPLMEGATLSAFYDVAQVEVLPGPQGTLYGADAAGGVVAVTSKMPTDGLDAEFSVEAGNYSLYSVFGALNVPIGDTLKARVAINHRQHDGYLSNGLYDEDSLAGRVTLMYEPTENFSLMTWGSYYKDVGNGVAVLPLPLRDAPNPWEFDYPAYPTLVGVSINNPGQLGLERDIENLLLGARLDLRLGGVNLTYIPGYGEINSTNKQLFATLTPGIPQLQVSHPSERQISHELRVSNENTATWRWLAGLFYMDQSLSPAQPGSFGASVAANTWRDIEAIAVFAEVSRSISERMRLTGGLRYGWDSKAAHGTDQFGAFTADAKWTNADWKVGVEMDLTDDSLVYANVRTGYLMGGFTLSGRPGVNSSPDNVVDPVELLAYTVGSKNQLQDGRLILNAELFFYDYESYQVGAFRQDIGQSVFTNADKAEVYGAEITARYQLTQDDQISLTAAYVNAEFTDFTVPFSAPLQDVVLDGYKLPYAPTLTVNLNYAHTWYFNAGSRLVASINSHYDDGHWNSFDHGALSCVTAPAARQALCQDMNRSEYYQERSYTKTDVNLSFYSRDDRWNVGLWAKNLEDVAIIASVGAGSAFSRPGGTIEAPRTYGIRFGMGF